jgi:hypothetical protein
MSLEAIARLGEGPAGDEEQSRYDDEEEIQHTFSLGFLH